MPAKVKIKKCLYKPCSAPFLPKYAWHKFHSDKCRVAHFKAGQMAFIRHARKIIAAQPGK